MRSRDADHVVGALIRARRRDEKLTAESEAGQLIRRHVRSIEDGFEIQNRTIKNRSLGNVAAWKVGPARKPDFEPWGLSEPGTGPIFELLDSCTVLRTPKNVAVIEAEIGMIVGKELTPRGRPYSQREVWEAVDRVAACFEVVGSRIGWSDALPAHKIADCANNVCVVLGSTRSARTLDPEDLKTVDVCISNSGREIAKGYGSSGAYNGSPLRSMTWLTNRLNRDGISLRKGDVVVTGACTLTKELNVGTKYTATFTGIGSVEFSLGNESEPVSRL